MAKQVKSMVHMSSVAENSDGHEGTKQCVHHKSHYRRLNNSVLRSLR